MVGYIEDLELISVADILKDVSLNNSSMSSTTNPSNLSPSGSQRFNPDLQDYTNMPEYGNNQRFDTAEGSQVLKIPNPVGYLQELCAKKGFTLPVYGVLKQDGPAHEPTFSTFCRVQDHYRVVSSKSKKRGKEMVARELIMCLKMAIDARPKTENATVPNFTSETISEAPSPPRSTNYVGFLQEYCVRKQLPPPYYGTEKSTGTPNNPSFYIFCEVGSYREVGIASNKKAAKQMAAEKILDLLDMKAEADPSLKESPNAENNETLQSTTNLNINDIQVLSESALKTVATIPNPVGHLQELCVKYRLRPPAYEIVKVDGPPHLPTFTTTCKVENLCQEAVSNNKKKGKEIAASKILNLLIDHHKSKAQ
ncbi:RISC-loading complex subunit tarbp2 isoform X3 [Bradysia coprophila]|uniref:RISC-loading complex subunit tarbp2 isoform X3 n=1 Tax=Bradysia coprophila TaxID=38358 RepID=UPI00187D8833|nr:RISC-loading complex subunit tarbp2 isoform X3 [Bradysia coprophila]XP_037044133.1 RISC-loading complex subunit tarbp2 isoform X3 [Bradysia coprophila]XP_037044134.1 RISC-loading complex subunit tarbp2 isoform X3 [Bradysia coprophila]XP_037044135.1 RISC-loading complex subunit tarbp2 isoform X3 [Bradysia coprophila]